MKTKNFKTFSNFLAYITRTNQKRIFRGQRSATWKLETRWHRFRTDNLDATHNSVLFRQLLNNYLRKEHDRVNSPIGDLTDTELETLGQHYGMPTRLMDWTTSPYVAAFFALDGGIPAGNTKGRCAIFELDVEAFCFASSFMVFKDETAARAHEARSYAFASELGFDNPRILEVSHRENLRMNRQEGVFIFLHDVIENLEKYENMCYESHPAAQFLTKITLPNSQRLAGLSELFQMGTTASSIYCDPQYAPIDAANRAMAELVQ